jgi:peptidoglycan hydrolase-like protein with peptidoglycan-binding domain
MDSYSYIELALVWENPTELKFVEGLNWQKLSSQAYIRLLSVALILSVLSVAGSAQALQRGDRGAEVRALQQELRSRGYFNAGITGNFSSITENAVRRFQRDQGLRVDGIAGPSTLGSLGLRGTTQAFNPSPGRNTAIRSIGFGSTDPEVSNVQRNLIKIGYLSPGNITGFYGTLTQNGIILFQRNYSLPQTGVADARTIAYLNLVASKLDQPSVPITGVCRGFSFGDRGQSVNLLQRQLKALGYFQGGVDGKFRERTRYAVTRFQQVNNLPSTGCADTATLEAIDFRMRQLSSYPSFPIQPANTPIPIPPTSSNLALGDTGLEVESLQRRLKELGYFKDNVTGYFGEVTEEALKRFQQDRQLSITGVADRNTLLALQRNTTPPIAQRSFSGNPYITLRRGNSGSAVRQLQTLLTNLGYYPGKIDGVFGAETQYAVVRFQQDSRILPTGIATPNTWFALQNASGLRLGSSISIRNTNN